ncbi:hypothetical protein PE067_05020 [Paracoccus sp. DMF-8]|uniref:hypothetical protein n=1 Tax=Paracoccus sp. DMF-8 TaxID=3019445 RepID=UPI0023E8EE6C|nr:hypothetical protein [Paracoccus sp. DMF-8]MDF3605563.1 hypothetical protein [Paracoccus sp. DMF-8]
MLTAEVENADYFEAVAQGRDGKQAANWVINELFGRLNKEGLTVETSPVSAGQLGGVIDLIGSGRRSRARLPRICSRSCGPKAATRPQIVESRGMKQVTDLGAIEAAVDDIIAANPEQVEKAKANPKLAGWFVGQVLKATGGKANPAAVNELVAKKLGQ